jgi:hypothetical protein
VTQPAAISSLCWRLTRDQAAAATAATDTAADFTAAILEARTSTRLRTLAVVSGLPVSLFEDNDLPEWRDVSAWALCGRPCSRPCGFSFKKETFPLVQKLS